MKLRETPEFQGILSSLERLDATVMNRPDLFAIDFLGDLWGELDELARKVAEGEV